MFGGSQGRQPQALNLKAWLPAPQPDASLEGRRPWKWVQCGQGPTPLGRKGPDPGKGWGEALLLLPLPGLCCLAAQVGLQPPQGTGL